MKLLYIDCCISTSEKPRTKELAEAFISSWKNSHPDDTIETVDLKTLDIKPLTEKTLWERENASDYNAPCFDLAHQFAGADRIVIAAPFWDLSFPSKFRVYIEQVSVVGITFAYKDDQTVGCCKADKLLVLTTAGGPLDDTNVGEAYLRALCRIYGIESVYCIGAPMQDVIGIDNRAYLDEAIGEAVAFAETF